MGELRPECQRCGCCCLGVGAGCTPFGILKIKVTADDLTREPLLRKEVEDGFLYTPCSFLDFSDDDIAICKIYTTRPQACVTWPPGGEQAQILGYPCVKRT